MIYVTGDCHADFQKFEKRHFPEQKEMTKKDHVIICGDFGGVWSGDEGERKRLQELSCRSFTTLFVDGNHENFDLLNAYPVVEYHGGKAHQIMPDIYHLMRGEIFELEGLTFFAFGGASSHDIQDGILDRRTFVSDGAFRKVRRAMDRTGKLYRVLHESWWPEELPGEEEMERGRKNLKERGNKVDYIISHCLPTAVQSVFGTGLYTSDRLTDYFDQVYDEVDFRHWYCGHYHLNGEMGEQFTILYERMVKIC